MTDWELERRARHRLAVLRHAEEISGLCCVGWSQWAGDWGGDIATGLLRVAGFRFPRAVLAVAVRWYLRYGLSYLDVEELLAGSGVTVDHVTAYPTPPEGRGTSTTPRTSGGP